MEEDEDDNSKGEEEDMRDPPNLKSQTTLCPNHKWAEVVMREKTKTTKSDKKDKGRHASNGLREKRNPYFGGKPKHGFRGFL
ncbi:hypothetical protein V6N13_019903 [Hibiscus sabdariffa]